MKTPEKELSSEEIANRSDAEFKTLVIGMLRELVEYNKCIREEMKATLSEIKKNPERTNSEGEEARVQINDLEYKEEKKQSEQLEEKKYPPQTKDRLRSLWDNFKCTNI